MESETSSCAPQQASNYDELFMQRSLLFADSLKDLKNLRKQLYSAAEYFELSYHKVDYNQVVVESLKDYVTKALINTVDHLGSVAYKVNNFLNEKVDEVSATKLRFSCVEQRLQTCQYFIDRGGLSQQSLEIKTPKYHKQYIIPGGDTVHAIGKTQLNHNSPSLCFEDNRHHQSKNAFQAAPAATSKSLPPLYRKGQFGLPSTRSSISPATFSFTRVASEKRAVSPYHFPFKRSGSVVNRSISPSSSNNKQRCPSEPQRSASLYTILREREKTKEIEKYTKRSKSLLQALLSIHKSKNDGGLYKYRDTN